MNLKRFLQKKLPGSKKKPKKGKSFNKGKSKAGKKQNKSLLALVELSRPFRILMTILVLAVTLYLIYQTVLLGLYNLTKFQNLDFSKAFPTSNTSQTEWNGKDRLNILVVLLNKSNTGHNQLESLSVLELDPAGKRVTWMFLPIEAYVSTKENGDIKVKDLYIVGENETPNGGYKYLYNNLENTLYIKFDRYIFLESAFVSRLLEYIGGMTVRIPDVYSVQNQRNRYRVAAFDENKIKLSHQSVLNFINDQSGGEEARLNRQALFFNGLVSSPDFFDLWKLVDISKLMEKTVLSNLASRDFNRIWNTLRSSLTNDSFSVLAPSTLTEKIDTEGKTIRVFAGSPVWDFIRTSSQNQQIADELARVEVFNGSAVPGAAYNYTVFLRNTGVDVIRRNNAPKEYKKSIVYVQDNTRPYDETVKQILKIMPSNTEVKYGNAEFLATGEIIVILGDDISSSKF